MTTEIAVMNRLGVALATDSAVTISGGGKTKIYNSAEKLFELSSSYPVGAMVNGNPDFMGVPWELLIKEFRSKYGSINRTSVNIWLDDLIDFISSHSGLENSIPEAYLKQVAEEEVIAVQIGLRNRIEHALSKQPRSKRRVDVKDLTVFFSESVKERRKEISDYGRADSLVDVSHHEIMTEYSEYLENLLSNKFLPYGLEKHEIHSLSENIVESMMSKNVSDYTSGIIVAGFGNESLYPEVVSMDITTKVAGILKTTDRATHNVEKVSDAGRVITFAQTDVIDKLLGGADPKFINQSIDYLEKAAFEAASNVEEIFRPKRLSVQEASRRKFAIDAVVEALVDEYTNVTLPSLRKKFNQDFDTMVAQMPKQELIELAEALVSITAVERKASSDEATVGGPIDVAFITRNEGFIWIKRKHYFSGDLNPNHFWRKYMQSGRGEPNE